MDGKFSDLGHSLCRLVGQTESIMAEGPVWVWLN